MSLSHGIPKLQAGIQATVEHALLKRGIEPAEPLAIALIFAAATTFEMAVIAYNYFPKFGWTGPGYEYPMMWGCMMFAIVLRGCCPYALDNKLGRTL